VVVRGRERGRERKGGDMRGDGVGRKRKIIIEMEEREGE